MKELRLGGVQVKYNVVVKREVAVVEDLVTEIDITITQSDTNENHSDIAIFYFYLPVTLYITVKAETPTYVNIKTRPDTQYPIEDPIIAHLSVTLLDLYNNFFVGSQPLVQSTFYPSYYISFTFPSDFFPPPNFQSTLKSFLEKAVEEAFNEMLSVYEFPAEVTNVKLRINVILSKATKELIYGNRDNYDTDYHIATVPYSIDVLEGVYRQRGIRGLIFMLTMLDVPPEVKRRLLHILEHLDSLKVNVKINKRRRSTRP